MRSLGPGTVVAGKYEILREVGRGGMGAVFVARQRGIGRMVAIKVLLPGAHPEVETRFLREGSLLAAMTHPNVVLVLDIVPASDDDPAAIVMEFVDGRSLAQTVKEDGPFDERRAVDIGIQLADAVLAAHTRGVIHRDIKPANVMLTSTTAGRDVVKLVDFGVARDTSATALTQEGAIVGTLSWLAPEQVLGAQADVKSDVYAVGATLYYTFIGRHPFPQPTLSAVARAIEAGERTPAATLRPTSRLGALIDRAMSTDRDARPRSAAEFATELMALAGVSTGAAKAKLPSDEVVTAIETAPGVAGAPMARPTAKRPWRRYVPIAAGISVVLVGAAAGARYASNGAPDHRPTGEPPPLASANETPVASASSLPTKTTVSVAPSVPPPVDSVAATATARPPSARSTALPVPTVTPPAGAPGGNGWASLQAESRALRDRDGRTCLNAIAAAKQDPTWDTANSGVVESYCLMLVGRCEEGKALLRAQRVQGSDEETIRQAAASYCPAAQLTNVEAVDAAQRDYNAAQTSGDKVALEKAADRLNVALQKVPVGANRGALIQVINAYDELGRCADARAAARRACGGATTPGDTACIATLLSHCAATP